jgi:hypothetical protein
MNRRSIHSGSGHSSSLQQEAPPLLEAEIPNEDEIPLKLMPRSTNTRFQIHHEQAVMMNGLGLKDYS